MTAGVRDRVLLGGATLSAAQHRQLVEALMRAGLGFENRREEVIERLRQRHSFQPRLAATDFAATSAMLTYALGDDEIFDDLLDEVCERLSADDPARLALTALIPAMLRRSSLTKQELAALLAIELRVPPSRDQLGVIARELWPGAPRRADLFADVETTARTLLDGMDPQAGMCRVVRFAHWVARYAEDMRDIAAERFQEWARQVTERHGLTVEAGWEEARAAASAADPPALLVELEPALKRGAYAVRLKVWRPGSGLEPLTGWAGENDDYRLEQLEERLGELIGLAAATFGGTGPRLRVEFQVDDDDLIRFTADRWRLATRRRGPFVPLGAERQVLVRPRREPFDPTEMQDWARRWRQVRTTGRRLGELCVWVPDETAYDELALWSHFDQYPDGVLVLPVGPPDKADKKLCELLRWSVCYGLPVALCVRRAPDQAADVLAALRQRLDGMPVADLPEQVRIWRREATRDAEHFGADLILLWDDHARSPGIRFSNPTVVPEEAV